MERHDLYEAIVPWDIIGTNIEVKGRIVAGGVMRVSVNLFGVLGVPPLAGRVVAAETGESESDPPAVISYRLWQNAFGRDPHLDRLAVGVKGTPHRVIGVMPPTVTYPSWKTGYGQPGLLPDVWLPLPRGADGGNDRSAGVVALVRLKRADTPGHLKTLLKVVGSRVLAQYPGERLIADYRVNAVSSPPQSITSFQAAIAGTTLLVLLVACLNLANLMLARGLRSQTRDCCSHGHLCQRWRDYTLRAR